MKKIAALVVALVGCADVSGFEAPTDLPLVVSAPELVVEAAPEQPWFAGATPRSPACRQGAGGTKEQGAAICIGLMDQSTVPTCTHNTRTNETTCGAMLIQWDYDGTAQVFTGDEFSAELVQGVDASALGVRFDNGAVGACQTGPHYTTLCVYADPRKQVRY